MRQNFKRCATALLFACAAVFSAGTQARAADLDRTVTFDIEAQPLEKALVAFSQQADIQVVLNTGPMGSAEAPALKGTVSAREGLSELLKDTGFRYEPIGDRTVSVMRGNGGTDEGSIRTTAVDAPPENGNSATSGSQATSDTSRGPEENSTKLEEIIVTATKRQESVMDVPISIAVITNQEIEHRGLIGMEDYLRSIPGVNQIDRGGRENSIVIRGITTSPEFENFVSGTTVASYFDETPITAAGGLGAGGIDVRPVDIERIEVLRGPQGTAYGSASLGGTVRMIPVKPKLVGFGAKLAASYSDTSGLGSDNSMIQGVVNIPVVADKFAVRVVGYRYDESGFYRNIAGVDSTTVAAAEGWGLGDFVRGFNQDNVGRILSTGGRLAALWQATDKLDLSVSFLTQNIEQDGFPVAEVGKFEQVHIPVAPQGRRRGEAGEIGDTKINLSNLVAHYDLGWAALTSAASWVDSGSVSINTGIVPLPFSTTVGPSDFRSFTAETRLASQLEGKFQFLGGVFYENLDEDFLQISDWPGTPATNPLPLFGLPATDPLLLLEQKRDLDQRAIFGEVSYALTDKLTATVGGRYFKYKKNERSLREGGFANILIGEGIAEVLKSSEDKSTFKANLSYKPTQDGLVYASWAQGFRLGRPAPGVPDLCDTNPRDGLIDGTDVSVESTRRINSDFLDSYEIGGKFGLLDGRMVFDTSVYHIEWDGLPIANLGGSVCNYVANAGAATSDGVEFQASLFVMKGLRLDFGAGYTKAELSKDALALGAEEGARLPGSPKVNANLSAQYDFNIGGLKAFARADSLYAGKFFGDLLETPVSQAGDYVKVDIRAGVTINSLSVELFARNLTNEDAFTWRGVAAPNANPLFYGYRLRPRTVGIQLAYIFE